MCWPGRTKDPADSLLDLPFRWLLRCEHRNRINQIENKLLMNFKMKPVVLAILASAALLFLFSCEEKQNEDVTQSVNKSGAIESSIKVEHLDSLHDVLVTTHVVWVRNNDIKTVLYRDTIPALGTEHTTAENQDGDTKNVTVKKDYEIFITVK